ncbi:MAG: bifunctional oligoribonuclease/PAP phosphatase NrnA [Lachnospiraceae bacterium]|nr:bifunctional oligoribonuclease/PAP phosphatase NrnA [Lachnospiraceae bacterium]
MNIIEEVKDYNSIAVSGHIKPDGDSIGSCIAMTLYLRKVFPDKDIRLFLEEVPECFKGIEGIDNVDSSFAGLEPEVYILIDATPDRMGAGEKLYNSAKKRINIDHHISNADGSGDVNYIDPKASSAAELVFRLIDKERLDKVIASWIYIGIVHDTGIFKFPSTSPDTMRAVVRLMEEGLDCQFLIDKTFYEKTYAQNIACAKIVEKSKLYLKDKVILGAISLREMIDQNITKNDFDGVINQLRITEGTEVAIFMYPINDVTMKVSLRSKRKVDVAEICQQFGGGGHIRAAGYYRKGTIDEITNELLEILSTKDMD